MRTGCPSKATRLCTRFYFVRPAVDRHPVHKVLLCTARLSQAPCTQGAALCGPLLTGTLYTRSGFVYGPQIACQRRAVQSRTLCTDGPPLTPLKSGPYKAGLCAQVACQQRAVQSRTLCTGCLSTAGRTKQHLVYREPVKGGPYKAGPGAQGACQQRATQSSTLCTGCQ